MYVIGCVFIFIAAGWSSENVWSYEISSNTGNPGYFDYILLLYQTNSHFKDFNKVLFWAFPRNKSTGN